MKLVVGLGNPGEKYENSRHNVGFVVVDRLRTAVYGDAKWDVEPKFEAVVCRPLAVDVLLAKPTTFMNDSGRAVRKLVTRYLVTSNSKETSHQSRVYESLFIIYDDLDIPLGKYKIQKGKGPRQHNGVESVDKALGTRQYWHVRVGIENRKVDEGREGRKSGEEYVLEDFGEDEEWILADVIKRITTDIYVRL